MIPPISTYDGILGHISHFTWPDLARSITLSNLCYTPHTTRSRLGRPKRYLMIILPYNYSNLSGPLESVM